MAKITIQIDVLNSKEIVKEKKGRLLGLFASIFMKEEDLKRKIEEKISEDIINGLKETLDKRFKEEGVAASLRISVDE
jgi:hypothetical protein